MFSDPKLIIAFIGFAGSIGCGLKWGYVEAKKSGEAEAEVKLYSKYENILNENLRFKFVCSCDSIR